MKIEITSDTVGLKMVFPGEAVAKQSTRFNRSGFAYQTKKIKMTARSIQLQIKSQLPKGFKPFDEPIGIHYKFIFPFTKRISMKKRKECIWKDTTPDIDNLQKMINDAMEPLVYRNDSRICLAVIEKIMGDTPRTEVVIYRLYPGSK